MSKRPQPRLHLIKDNADPELYCADLDWYYGQYDSECGLKSIAVADAMAAAAKLSGKKKGKPWSGDELTARCGSAPVCTEPDPYTDRHVCMDGSREGSFTRGRRVWQRLSRLRWEQQMALREHYEPRMLLGRDEKTWESDGGFKERQIQRQKPTDAEIRAAHRGYYGSAA